MKKQVKVLSIMLIVLTVLCSLSTIVLADVASDLTTIGKGNSSAKTEGVVNLGATIVTIMQTVGVVVAVVVLLILGIKYMMGSAEEKAEYKKTMIPYLVGAILIFASTTIVSVVYNVANGLNSTANS